MVPPRARVAAVAVPRSREQYSALAAGRLTAGHALIFGGLAAHLLIARHALVFEGVVVGLMIARAGNQCIAVFFVLSQTRLISS